MNKNVIKMKNATTLSIIITNTYSHYIQGETPTFYNAQSYGLKKTKGKIYTIRVSSHLKKKKKIPDDDEKKKGNFQTFVVKVS